MKFHALATICIFTLASCASSIMEGFVGKDISEVMVRYGPPTSQFELPDGRVAFQWKLVEDIVIPQTTNYSGYNTGNYVSGTATTTGGYLGTSRCLYTLYAHPNERNSYTIIGFERPNLMCE